MNALFAVLLATAAALVAVTTPLTERRLHQLAVASARRPGRGGSTASTRLERTGGRRTQRARRSPGAGPLLLTPAVQRALGMAAGLALFAVVGGAPGIGLGAAMAVGLPAVVARLPDHGAAQRMSELRADLPLGLDLVSSCLAAGAPLGSAVGAVAAELPGPLSDILTHVARQLALGADPAIAWRRAAILEPLQGVVETVTRVGDSGAALVPALRRLAADERDRRRQEQEATIRRVGVFVVIPLGICFLPAFLLIGIVPIVAGLVGGLLP